jgi:ABC-type transport system involved in cytochrome c biogenesis permease subunit
MDKVKRQADKRLPLLACLAVAYTCFADVVVVSEVNNPRFAGMLWISSISSLLAIVTFVFWKRSQQKPAWLKYAAVLFTLLVVAAVILLLNTPRKVTDHQYHKVKNPFAH